MKEKIISLKHARLRKRDEEMDARNKRERSIRMLLEEIATWWIDPNGLLEEEADLNTLKYPNIEEPPEFVRIAKEINEMGIDDWLLENAEEEGLIEKREEHWTDIH